MFLLSQNAKSHLATNSRLPFELEITLGLPFYDEPIVWPRKSSTETNSFIINRKALFYGGSASLRDHSQAESAAWGLPSEHYFSTPRKQRTTSGALLEKIFDPKDLSSKKKNWRLKFIAFQLQAILERHKRLPYKDLIDKHCPRVKLQPESMGHLTHHQVYLCMRAIFLRLLPSKLFGTSFNRGQFFRALKHFIHLRRYDSVDSNVYFRWLNIGLLTSFFSKQSITQNHIPTTEIACVRDLFRCVYFWLFNDLVVALLRVV